MTKKFEYTVHTHESNHLAHLILMFFTKIVNPKTQLNLITVAMVRKGDLVTNTISKYERTTCEYISKQINMVRRVWQL